MKVVLAMILAVATAARGSVSSSSSSSTTASLSAAEHDKEWTPLRALQNNNQYQYYYQDQQSGAQYENYDQYLRAQIAKRTFSFTGCSTQVSNYGWNIVYATFRICDHCYTTNSNGCGNDNGDYVVAMEVFGEAFGEYWQQTTYQAKDSAPLRCVRADEYVKAYYQQQMYSNNGGQANQQAQENYQYRNYNAQQQQQQGGQEYFVGPTCDGGRKIKLGLFWDENCAMPVEKWNVASVLGFDPNENGQVEPPKCVPCASASNNYNGGQGNGEVDLNPLCDRMLEEAGRCDRNMKKETKFDVSWNNGQQNRNGGGGGDDRNNFYYGQMSSQGCPSEYNVIQCQNKHTCELIDSLPHMRRQRRMSGIGITLIVLSTVSAVAAVVYFAKDGRLGLRGVRLTTKKEIEEPIANADYQAEQKESPVIA